MPYNCFRNYQTIEGSLRIELSYLFENKYLIKGSHTKGSISWFNKDGTRAGQVSIETAFDENNKWIKLSYNTKNSEGINEDFEYKIFLIPVPSNLHTGGYVYHFKCPVTTFLCRILYLCKETGYFKSRYAFGNNIYYQSQIANKSDYSITRYFAIKDILEKMSKLKMKKHYRGFETKTFKRYQRLKNSMEYYDKSSIRFLGGEVVKLKKRLGM